MANSTIKAQPDVIVRTQIVSVEGTMPSSDQWVNVTQVSGYTPIALVGYHEYTSIFVYYYNFYLHNNAQINVGWRTIDGSSIKDHSVVVYVLYKKN